MMMKGLTWLTAFGVLAENHGKGTDIIYPGNQTYSLDSKITVIPLETIRQHVA